MDLALLDWILDEANGEHIFCVLSMSFILYVGHNQSSTGSDVGNSSGTDSPDDDGDSGGNNSSPSAGDLKSYVSVQLSNQEIQSLFHPEWLRNHLMDSVNRLGQGAACSRIFQNMVWGSMVSFAKEFMKMVWTRMSSAFLGSREYVYQAFVCGFFTVAGQFAASSFDLEEWVLDVEGYSGISRFDCSMHRNSEACIHEYTRIKMSKQDQMSGPYSDLQRERLTKEAQNGLSRSKSKDIGHGCRMKSPTFANMVLRSLVRIAQS